MKVASKSGFLVFLGTIFAARNVAHVRAALTLPSPPAANMITDLIPAITTALTAPPVYIGALAAWAPTKQMVELQDWR
jgi:hypothetical protein